MSSLSRRQALHSVAGALVASTTLSATSAVAQAKEAAPFKVRHGKIRQSVMGWCFNPMPALELAQHCQDIGLVAIEGISSEHYPAVRKLGLSVPDQATVALGSVMTGWPGATRRVRGL